MFNVVSKWISLCLHVNALSVGSAGCAVPHRVFCVSHENSFARNICFQSHHKPTQVYIVTSSSRSSCYVVTRILIHKSRILDIKANFSKMLEAVWLEFQIQVPFLGTASLREEIKKTEFVHKIADKTKTRTCRYICFIANSYAEIYSTRCFDF